MSTTESVHIPLQVTPGVCPSTDASGASTPHYVFADKVRFLRGKPQKIGGWQSQLLNGCSLQGKIRSIFSSANGGRVKTLLGSHSHLYALVGSTVQNVTPAKTTSVAVANSLDTHYDTLGSDPISTTSGSNQIIISDSDAAYYVAGDLYTLAGATAVGGIGTSEINKQHIIREISGTDITLKVSSNATSTATGGGASVVRSSGLITVNSTAHGIPNCDRVFIDGAGDFGGFTAATEVNLEFIVRNVTTNTFDIMTAGTATSSVSGGGGASTEYYEQIEAGLENATSGQGYGMGEYGDGLYGTALVSSGSIRLPRIWFMDVYGASIICTPGGGSEVYSWDGTFANAPAIITNAPTDVNYAFVSNNILVTFGADGVNNRIKASDQKNITQWTSSSTNQVYTDDVEGASKLLSHLDVNGINLIFDDNSKCYTFRYIGLPDVWEIKFKDFISIIAPLARVTVKGVGYFMGTDNFYMWRGGNIEVIPSNTSEQSTILRYVFENINRGQQSKSYAWYNKRYDEIWFHYPSAGSNECDRIARYNVTEKHWTMDTIDRSAVEYPNNTLGYPRLIDPSDNTLYRHEITNDADGVAMPWSLTTNIQNVGTDNSMVEAVIPDSVQAGDITAIISARSYPQSTTAINSKTVTISPDTQEIPIDVDGRCFQLALSGEELNQNWIMGNWLFARQQSARAP